MVKIFNKCPACGGALIITECQCTACKLQMRGEFQPDQFSRLSDDQLTFIKVFLLARGNLTEVERVLGISYPTIRNKLDEVNTALNQAEEKKPESQPKVIPGSNEERRAVLEKVAAGQLSNAEALLKLQGQKGDK